MAVTKEGNFIRMTANNDEVEGKFVVQKIMWACGTGNHTVQIATGPEKNFLFIDARSAIHTTTQVTYDPPIRLENIKVIEKQTAASITVVIV